MGKKKKLIDLLVFPEQAFLGPPSPKQYIVPGVILLLEKGNEQLTFIHECKTGYEAFALAIDLCARISRIDSRFSMRHSVETNEYVIHTSHGDTIVISYADDEVFEDFEVGSRVQSFRVLLFLFREVRKIRVVNVCVRENFTNRYFALEINGMVCAMVHYDAHTEPYGSPYTLQREMELVLNGRQPISNGEQKAMNMGERIFEAYSHRVIPEQFSFLSSIDTSVIRLWEQVLVSMRSSCPQQMPKTQIPVLRTEKRVKKQRYRQISQQKAIEKKSYNSFWDRIEMRGDHDD